MVKRKQTFNRAFEKRVLWLRPVESTVPSVRHRKMTDTGSQRVRGTASSQDKAGTQHSSSLQCFKTGVFPSYFRFQKIIFTLEVKERAAYPDSKTCVLAESGKVALYLRTHFHLFRTGISLRRAYTSISALSPHAFGGNHHSIICSSHHED